MSPIISQELDDLMKNAKIAIEENFTFYPSDAKAVMVAAYITAASNAKLASALEKIANRP